MADQARNTLSLADFLPKTGSQSSGQPNEPTRQANDAEMAPQGVMETHQAPPPTDKDVHGPESNSDEPGATEKHASPGKPASATTAHGTQQKQKNKHTKTKKEPTQYSTSSPPHKNGTGQQSQGPPQGEQAQANATPNNPWMSGQSLADRLSNKKTRTMRLWLPNASDTQRLIAMSLESMVDPEKRIEHFEFIKRVNKDLGWNMDYDTPLIIPVPNDLKATRITVAECINTEQTDSVVLEMIRQKRISKVHFQQHRHQTIQHHGSRMFPRSKIPLADHHYMDIIGLGHSFDYMELFTKLLTKRFRPVHITPKEMDKNSNMSSGDIRVYMTITHESARFVTHRYTVLIWTKTMKRHDISRHRRKKHRIKTLNNNRSPNLSHRQDLNPPNTRRRTQRRPTHLSQSTNPRHKRNSLMILECGTNRDLTIATDETNPLQDWHSPNLFERLESMHPDIDIEPNDSNSDYIIERCPMTTIKYKKIHLERVDAKITKRLKKKSQQGKPPRVDVAVDDWNISDIAQTMVKTTEHMNPTENLAAAHKAKASYLKLAAKFTTLVDWEKYLELIRQEPLGSYLALDHIRRVDPSEYKNILERHLHQRLQSATFHIDTMSGTQAFETIFKDKPTTRDGIMTAFNSLLQQIQPTELQVELMWAQWDLILQCLVPQLYNCDAWVLYYTKHTVNWLPTQHMRLLSNDSLHRLLLSPLGDKLVGWIQSQKWEDDSVETLVNFKSQSPGTFAMALQIISEADKLLLRYQHLQYPLLS
ncbi:hypothetical protein LEN26_016694 [Aphanomyces euteiches]|nr:hypothetical protein LEN26_016694 [Aphanomyces euteiches]